MLHIHNGDSSANTAKQSSLPGEHVAFRESLITGPTPSGLSDNEWRRVRSGHLSEAYGVATKECEQGLLTQEETLASFSEHDEVVLWFEHDLFCQLHLIYLLDWFSRRDLGKTTLSLVCIGEFPGRENFRGLGELTSDELASLFPKRQRVSSAQIDLATAAWNSYCSPEPTDIEKLLQGDTSALPFLYATLKAHLQRFPTIRNGLGRIENKALEIIQGGAQSFLDLFSCFAETESIYGLGDAQVWLALKRLSVGKQTLIKIEDGKNRTADMTAEVIRNTKFEITDAGESVLHGEADFVELCGIDLWLGGVQLSRSNLLRWDESSGTIVSD